MDTAIELEIGPGPEPGTYVVRVLRSVGGGEPVETITLDVDELVSQRPHVEASILSSSVSTRRIMSDTEAAVQGVGIRLFDATFTGDIRTAYRTSAAVAAERGTGVQIALRLDAPASPRCRGSRCSIRRRRPTSPQGAAGASRACAVLAARADGHPAPQGPRDDLVAGRPARAGRRSGARPARGGASTPPRRGTGASCTGWTTSAGPACTTSSSRRSGTCCTSSATACTTPRPTRACSRSSDATAAPTTSRLRGSPTSSTRRSRRRDSSSQLVPVRGIRHPRPLLGHGGGARAQRDPRGRRDAVLDQRRCRDRVRPRVLQGARTRAGHRRGGAQRAHRHPRPQSRNARVDHARAVPPR